MTALDPRSPLVVDTRELGRRPGASLRMARTAPAPAELGGEVIGVPEGSPLHLELLLEAVMEGVLVSGSVRGTTAGQCVRCLEDIAGTVDVRLQELYAYPGRTPAGDDEDLLEMQGDLIDLEPALRDAVVPTLPFQPVCRPDCPGLPTRYGPQDDEPSALPDDVDPRWAALARLTGPSAGPSDQTERSEQYETKEG